MRRRRALSAAAFLILAACSPPDSDGSLRLRVDADGSFDLGGRHLANEAALKSEVRDLHVKTPGALIVVEAGKGASYMQIARAMADLQASGEVRIGIVGTETYPH